MKLPNGLTDKQQRFVDEYLIDLNATQAYKRAGYSAKTDDIASSNAIILLGNQKVASAIDIRRKEISDKLNLKQEDIVRELVKLAFSNMQDFIAVSEDGCAYIDLSGLTRDQAAAIQEVNSEHYYEPGETKDDAPKLVKKCKLKLSDKGQNLERLGKHLQMFTDKVIHIGDSNNPIEIIIRPIDYRTELAPLAPRPVEDSTTSGS